MQQYNEFLSFDNVLHKQDILGSITFARANTRAGRLTEDGFKKMEAGLLEVEKEREAGTFKVVPGADEDIHTANERRLGETIGKDVAGKLHTGRSFNEQVATTDMRLWLRDELDKLSRASSRASSRPAHPLEPLMLSYGFAFANDLERLREIRKRVNRSPLGCGALVVNSFGMDREMILKGLGFEELLWNSMGAVADRDFVLETLQWGSVLVQHISRWAEDHIKYSSAEFGFVWLADAYSTGSSLMPQKKNLDSLENKDVQESVEPLLHHVKTVGDSIQMAEGVLSTLATQPQKIRAALDPFILATDVAEYLVRKGVPFRETHHISGRCVALSEQTGTPMNELTYEQMKGVDAWFDEDFAESFDYEKSVKMRAAKGGTSKACVLEQVKVLAAMIA